MTTIRNVSDRERQLCAEIDALKMDAARYCAVLGMPSDRLLQLYNTRFDLRQQFIDAAMKEGAQ